VHVAINKLHERLPTLILREIAEGGRVNLYCSFCREVTTRAKEQGDELNIEMNNRWRKLENKQGGLPNLPMTQLYYVEITQALTSKFHFSLSLKVSGLKLKDVGSSCGTPQGGGWWTKSVEFVRIELSCC